MSPDKKDPQGDASRPQIVYAWNYTNWGGAQIYFFGLIKEARKHYRIKVLLPANSPKRIFDYLDHFQISYDLLPASPTITPSPNLFQKILAHVRWVQSERRFTKAVSVEVSGSCSILHADLGFWRSFMPLFRLSLKTGVFVTIHTALPQISGWRGVVWKLKGGILGRMKNFRILTSNMDARWSLTPFLPADQVGNIPVAYSGFDADEINAALADDKSSGQIRERHRLPLDRVVLLAVGQFIERKGCWVLLRALTQLKAQSSNFTFVWMSTSEADDQLKAKIAEYKLGEHFRLMSPDEVGAERHNLLCLMNAADIFVLPSLEEGLPIALVEAMAIAKPCLATRINAIPEAIEEGATGRLVEPGDELGLCDAMMSLMSDPEQRVRLGAAAQTKAFQHFDSSIGARTTVAAYTDYFDQRNIN